MYFLQQLSENGFAIAENIFTEIEINSLIKKIALQEEEDKNFKEKSVFAIRHFLGKFPQIKELIFNHTFDSILGTSGKEYRLVKSIYFDKPPMANWVVNWHQDLTISVQNKEEIEGFTHWLPKEGYFSVQPPQVYLEDIMTLRIHLDDCTKQNGALRVIPKSHLQIKHEKSLPSNFFEKEEICEVRKGSVLAMKPMIWHNSKRTENQAQRRVIHLEFSSLELPAPLLWAERIS